MWPTRRLPREGLCDVERLVQETVGERRHECALLVVCRPAVLVRDGCSTVSCQGNRYNSKSRHLHKYQLGLLPTVLQTPLFPVYRVMDCGNDISANNRNLHKYKASCTNNAVQARVVIRTNMHQADRITTDVLFAVLHIME
jgi:hypothetical protein